MRVFCRGLLLLTCLRAGAQPLPVPTDLRTDLLTHTDRVWQNGLLTNVSPATADSLRMPGQLALIRSRRPSFGWVVSGANRQTAYQIRLSMRGSGPGDGWDSGKVTSGQSAGVLLPASQPLQPDRLYEWTVRVWDEQGRESAFSRPKTFRTAPQLTDYATPFYPLVKTEDHPVNRSGDERSAHYDFGQDTFGQLRLTATTNADTDTLVLHLGEAVTTDGRVDRKPAGTLRYRRLTLPLQRGTNQYALLFRPDKRNTGPKAMLMPDYIGEVLPFRYVDIDLPRPSVRLENVVRQTVTYPFDNTATTFTSSDTTLNRIWQLCKETIRATSFTGYYVDGDRERIPYEADALLNQLAHYATDAEYTMAKRSLDYLVFHATWPTEWSLQNVLIAWYDYLYSGDSRTATALYPDLRAKLLLPLARPDGLISTRTGLQTDAFKKSIHYDTFDGRPTIQDIVDWPQQGVLGLGKKEAGETDGFVFRDYNSVVNAFHYQALVYMARLAAQLGKADDATLYSRRAAQVMRSFQTTFIDPQTGLVRDGEGTDHSSLHANMMALAFGLVPAKNQSAVLAHIRSRGMACSVYGSQFLLDALYNAHESQYALALLTSTDERSWYNMIRTGSTLTTEAWDTRYKPNQDWNHAWGSAPANIIVRKLMGVEPLTPAFETVQIKPQPGPLREASLQLATLRGPISVAFTNAPNRFMLRTTLPGNTRGVVYLPRWKANERVRQNGRIVKAVAEGTFWKIDGVGPGTYEWAVN